MTEKGTEPPELGLIGKLVEVAQLLDHVEKNGRNDHHGYDYVKAEDVFATVRGALLERGVLLIPGAMNPSHQGTLTTVNLTYTFVDAKTGEREVIEWVGVGFDKGGDKGIYKAYTGALKYLFLQTFLIPTGDDPEGDRVTDPAAPVTRSGAAGSPRAAGPPAIPVARATKIATRTKALGMNGEAVAEALAKVGADRISTMTVDQAEAFEAALPEAVAA